jgi:hypothetical protein
MIILFQSRWRGFEVMIKGDIEGVSVAVPLLLLKDLVLRILFQIVHLYYGYHL